MSLNDTFEWAFKMDTENLSLKCMDTFEPFNSIIDY